MALAEKLLETILTKLTVANGPDTRGEYLCLCPFHPDREHPNLHVSVRGYNCFACDAKGGLHQLARHLEIPIPDTASDAGQSETPYPYHDEEGNLLFEVVRYYRGGEKGFYQRRPDGSGGHIKDLKGVRRILYRLPELLERATEPVCVVEGEKDVDRLMRLGFLATTNPGGAGKWRKEYSEFLKDRDVILLGDNDEPGRKHIANVAKHLKGLAKSIKLVELPHIPKGADVSDWLDRGGTAEKLAELIAKTPSNLKNPSQAEEFVILDAAPESVSRPLSLVGGHGYSATWVYNAKGTRAPVVVRDDGVLFTNAKIGGTQPLEKLGILVQIHDTIPDSRAWSGAGIKRYMAGERPSAKDVFTRIVAVVDYFMDFDRSLAPQQSMCELVACYIVATYLLDAFFVIGYLWPNGNKGSGKTRLLEVIVEVAYLGLLILNSSTLATLRDLADCGATLAFDDAEGVMDKRADPDKRAFFLAGNRKGSTISLKEQVGDGWKIRHYRTYCPRLFSAIRLPDDVLGSRTITIPLVRSSQKTKTDRNPQDHSTWPHDRQRLVDDLWAFGLANLSKVGEHDAAAAAKSSLSGRNLEPWRAILAVAHLLDEEGLEGLFARMEELSRSYQKERATLEKADLTRIAILCLVEMAVSRPSEEWIFATKELTQRINELAIRLEVQPEDDASSGEKKPFASTVRVGKLLERLRFERPESRDSIAREWKTGRAQIAKLCLAHGLPVPWEEDSSAGAPASPVPEDDPGGLTRVTGLASVTGEGKAPPGDSPPAGAAQSGLDELGGGSQEPVTPTQPVTPVKADDSGNLTGLTGLTDLTGEEGPPDEAPPCPEAGLPPEGGASSQPVKPATPVRDRTPTMGMVDDAPDGGRRPASVERRRRDTGRMVWEADDGPDETDVASPLSPQADKARQEAEEYQRRRASLPSTRGTPRLEDRDPGSVDEPNEGAEG